MRYQKLKVSHMVVVRDEGTFRHTTEMLTRGSRSCEFTLLDNFFLRVCHRTHLYSTIWHSDGRT